jgi:hypothetical protein
MRPYGSRPGIPSPVGVTDPVVLRILLAMRESIERLTDEVETLKRQVNLDIPTPLRADAMSGRRDVCDND